MGFFFEVLEVFAVQFTLYEPIWARMGVTGCAPWE